MGEAPPPKRLDHPGPLLGTVPVEAAVPLRQRLGDVRPLHIGPGPDPPGEADGHLSGLPRGGPAGGASLPAYLPAYLPASLPPCLPTKLPAF